MPLNFQPHPAVRGGQMQTLVAYLWSSTKPLPSDELWTLALPDGDELGLDINQPKVLKAGTPIVYMMHGLGGCADSSYKRRIAEKLVPLGFRVIRHNHRGCGAKALSAKGIYHSGSVEDVLHCVRSIANRWPDSPIFIIGFSLSGTILLNLLGQKSMELRAIAQLKAAMSVCAPVDLHASSRALSAIRNKHYDLFYSKTTISQLRSREIISKEFVAQKLLKPTLRKIDECITAPMGGYQSADQYYDLCSPQRTSANIQLPTLILAAADDPIVPSKQVRSMPLSARTLLSLQSSGGHLGFISRSKTEMGDHRWLDSTIKDWLIQGLRKS